VIYKSMEFEWMSPEKKQQNHWLECLTPSLRIPLGNWRK
jgi:hypothetical protein